MSTKYLTQKHHQLAPPLPSFNNDIPPLPISKRKLPPLPISKRELPSLPRSKSGYVYNECSNDTNKETVNKKSPIRTSIIVTPPQSDQSSEHNSQSSHYSLRNFINKVQIKLSGTKTKLPNANSNGTTSDAIHITKSKWKPTLQFIIDDNELLNELIAFMTNQYNQENILFIQSVHKLQKDINNLLLLNTNANVVQIAKIDACIESIYSNYISHGAQQQINVSYDCFNDIMYIYQKFKQLSLTEKAHIFENCMNEITTLIRNSILTGFYNSKQFQRIAIDRNKFDNCNNNVQTESEIVESCANRNENESEYDSDDIEYENNNINMKIKSSDVCFDVFSENQWKPNKNKYMLSSKAFVPGSGIHEWKIKILKCSKICRQEFGIVSNCNKNNVMNEYGILDTDEFGAKAVYGYNALIKLNKNKKYKGSQHNFYYGSYNKDNTVRCNKDLSTLNMHQRPWIAGDVIKICVNLAKPSIKFFLNNKQVRKVISIEKDTSYYPIILYSGDCKFEVIS